MKRFCLQKYSRWLQRISKAKFQTVASNSSRKSIPSSSRRCFKNLAARGFLEQMGQKRGSSYRLPTWTSSLSPASSLAQPASARLLEIARPAREKKKLISSLSKAIIRQLCSGQYLTADEIGSLMNRGKDKLQKNVLSEMVDSGELKLRFPNQPTHPDQAYTANPERIES